MMPRGKGRKRSASSRTSPGSSKDPKQSRSTSKVFVSYCHDPQATTDEHVDEQERQRGIDRHRLYARDLSDYLRKNGVDCTLDQYYEDQPPPSWPRWMEQQIEESEFVLMVCSSSYYDLVRQGERARGRGHGSQFEGRVIYGYLSKDPTARKFIPVFFGRRVTEQIPTVVADSTSYEFLFPLDKDMPEQKDLRRLYRHLVGTSELDLPPLGEKSLSIVDETQRKVEEDQVGQTHKDDDQQSNSDMNVLSEHARRLKLLNAEDLSLDGIEVSVKSVSNYACVIECMHKDALEFECNPRDEESSYLSCERKLIEVNVIAQLPMISKIRSLEMIADIKMGVDGSNDESSDDESSDVDTRSTDITGEAVVECKLKSGESIKETMPLCEVLDDEYCQWNYAVHPEPRLQCKVHDEIHQASLTASICNKCVGSVSLENIRTIITAAVTQ